MPSVVQVGKEERNLGSQMRQERVPNHKIHRSILRAERECGVGVGCLLLMLFML